MTAKGLLFFSVIFFVQNLTNSQTYITAQNIELIISYAKWKSINQLIIFDESIKIGDIIKAYKCFLNILTKNNLYVSFMSSTVPLQQFMIHLKNRTSVVTILKYNLNQDKLIEQASNLTQFGENLSWFIIVERQDVSLNYLRFANFGLDADIVIAVATTWARTEAHLQILNNVDTQNDNIATEPVYYYTEGQKLFLPFLGTNSTVNTSFAQFYNNSASIFGDKYCFIQIYKIRRFYKNSLVLNPLGFWNSINGTKNLKPFLNTEKRNNFFQFSMIFGLKNMSLASVSENIIEDDTDGSDLSEFMNYVCEFTNSSQIIMSYSMLGTKTADGEWSDLLGAIINEEVDIGLESIIRSSDRYCVMFFSYSIMKFGRNIYVKPQKSHELRDIFSVPFNSRLIFCVIGIAVILTIVKATYHVVVQKYKSTKTSKRSCGFSDSLIWCIGILTQQGSIFKPKSCSEQIIIVVSLAFALLIYNSYSAFITSVLSIKLTNIRTVGDLLESDYEIGYVKNSRDEIYLRSQNDSQLNQIYLRGYLHNNISNITEGLVKATKGNYGFFASAHVARRELLNIYNYKCEYDIDEIPIKYTINYIAFPMSKRSPYKKIINLSLIKMYETGVFKYVHNTLYPKMRKCENPTTFESARLPDLSTAYGILILGHILSIIFIIIECIWTRKKEIVKSIKRRLLHEPIHHRARIY